jgi:thiol:disulfide interchange protein DsbC
MKLLHILFLTGALLAGAPMAWADDMSDKIRTRFQTLLPGQEVSSIEKAPVEGFYEVIVGSEVMYMSVDAKHLFFNGSLYDLSDGVVNLTEERRNGLRREAIAAIGEDSMISFGPADAQDTITVFTDIDCGYCRRLHNEIEKYNAAGIRVRYLFFPRSGPGTDSFRKAVSVWCADDRREAMTAAKRGDDVEARDCDNPVGDQYNLGRELGVSGTPALLFDNGELVPGYVPADRLKPMLDAARTGASS